MIQNKVMQIPNKQFVVTFPKQLADMIGLKKGDNIEWVLEKGEIIIRRSNK